MIMCRRLLRKNERSKNERSTLLVHLLFLACGMMLVRVVIFHFSFTDISMLIAEDQSPDVTPDQNIRNEEYIMWDPDEIVFY